MTLQEARQLIGTCKAQMNAAYRRPVFDEWAVVSLEERRPRLVAYVGPRLDIFEQNFMQDAGALRRSLLAAEHAAGDFEFARNGVGTGYESYMALGNRMFLICNNTAECMDGIAADPLWLGAQVPFVEMSDRFRADPVA